MKLTSFLKKNIPLGTDDPDPAPGLSTEATTPALSDQNDPDSGQNLNTAVLSLKAAIPETVEALHSFTEGSEADFMLLGIGLRTVHANVSELTDLMLGTVKSMGAEGEGGFLDRGLHILNDSMADIQVRQNAVKEDLERINTLMEDIENLHTSSKQIKKFAQSLKAVALTMLVENARTIDQSVNIFSDVAQEIKDLSVNITHIANDVYRNVEMAREVHHITRDEISAGIGRLETLTHQIRETVQESTRDTEELMRFSIKTIEDAGRRSREISQQVAEIVVGVQFHDNMKQRVINITDILNAVLTAPASRSGEKTRGRSGARQSVAVVLRHQARKLNEINNELDEVYGKNKNALKNIDTEVEDLLTGLHNMAASEGNIRSGSLVQDPFSHLKIALTQLHDLLNRGETFYLQIQETAKQVSGIAADLSKLLGVVRSISANTHNKAINSIIAANRQGEKGGALKLLAQAMNDLATRSDGFYKEVEGIITSIIKAAENIGRKSTRDKDSGSAINDLEKIIYDISLEYERFREKTMTAFARAKELKKATDTTLASLEFFRGLSRKIVRHRDGLTDMAAGPGQESLLIPEAMVAGGHLPGRHTAEREDNIVIFDDTPPADGNGGQEPLFSERLAENVELF